MLTRELVDRSSPRNHHFQMKCCISHVTFFLVQI